MQLQRIISQVVSIFILTENDAGGLFLNIMLTVLFICLCMWFCIFSILIKLFNNELVRPSFGLPVAPSFGFHNINK
jgi:hypothetical protein